jgi:hypothetical protein
MSDTSNIHLLICDRHGYELFQGLFSTCPRIGEMVSIEDGYYTEEVLKVIHSEDRVEVWIDCVKEERCEDE